MSVIRPLPAKPNLEHERKAAKVLLRQLRSGNSEAVQRAQAHVRGLTTESLPELKLGDAQRIIAREYGFTSWTRLVQYFGDVERQRHEHLNGTGWRGILGPALSFSSNVQQLLGGYASRSEFAGRALAAYVPRFYGSTVDEVFESAVSETDAQLAVARFEGFGSWTALMEAAAAEKSMPAYDPWHVDEWTDASEAICANDLPALKRLVDVHPHMLERTTDSNSGVGRLLARALSLAEHHNNLDIESIVRWLKSHGAALNPVLCWRGGLGTREYFVRQVLDLGADANWVMPNGRSVLEHALVAWRNGDAVDVLAARAKARDALWIAAGLGDVAAVARWLDAKGKPRAGARRDRPDFSAIAGRMMPQIPEPSDEDLLEEVFWVAMSNDRGNVVEYLVRHGFDANGQMFGARYVAVAAEEVRPKSLEALVRNGADVNLRGARFDSARDTARSNYRLWPTVRYRQIAELVGLDPDAEWRSAPVSDTVLEQSVEEALQLASDDAHRVAASELSVEHLLIGLLRVRYGVQQIVRHHGGHFQVRSFLRDFGARLLAHNDVLGQPMLPLSAEVQEAIDDATTLARSLHREHVTLSHLLLVLLRDDQTPIAQLLSRYGSQLPVLRGVLERH